MLSISCIAKNNPSYIWNFKAIEKLKKLIKIKNQLNIFTKLI